MLREPRLMDKCTTDYQSFYLSGHTEMKNSSSFRRAHNWKKLQNPSQETSAYCCNFTGEDHSIGPKTGKTTVLRHSCAKRLASRYHRGRLGVTRSPQNLTWTVNVSEVDHFSVYIWLINKINEINNWLKNNYNRLHHALRHSFMKIYYLCLTLVILKQSYFIKPLDSTSAAWDYTSLLCNLCQDASPKCCHFVQKMLPNPQSKMLPNPPPKGEPIWKILKSLIQNRTVNTMHIKNFIIVTQLESTLKSRELIGHLGRV